MLRVRIRRRWLRRRMHGNVSNEGRMRWRWWMGMRMGMMRIILIVVGAVSTTGDAMEPTAARNTRRRRGR